MRRKRPQANEIWTGVLFNYLGKRCQYCGSIEDLEIHHSIPLYFGGKNELSNLEVVCPTHHVELHRQLNKVLPRKWPKSRTRCDVCSGETSLVDNGGYYCEECQRIFKR